MPAPHTSAAQTKRRRIARRSTLWLFALAAIVPLFSRDSDAAPATSWACGDGAPNVEARSCDCPPGKVSYTNAKGVAQCIVPSKPATATSTSTSASTKVTAPSSKPTEPTTPPRSDACTGGQVKVAGHCCWQGQDWGVSAGRCVGTPSSCPSGTRREKDTCVAGCDGGKELVGGHCCWPGQDWGAAAGACIGERKCPDGYKDRNGDCVETREHHKASIQKAPMISVVGGALTVPRDHVVCQVEAGPLWNGKHAQDTCPGVCSKAGAITYAGAWRTTRRNEMSVCDCEFFEGTKCN